MKHILHLLLIKVNKGSEALQKDDVIIVRSIYFDGSKDNRLYQDKIGVKLYRSSKKEGHISLIRESDSKYIGHVMPMTGTGKNICENVVLYLSQKNILI